MHPVICSIGPFNLYSYGLMLVIAFIVGSFLACIQAKKENINPDTILNFLFISFIAGIIGARIFYVSYNMGYYLKNPLEIIMLQKGGLSWFGGLILGSTSGFIYLKKNKLRVLKTLDLVIPFLALGQAIGRIGCLLNGCCFGEAPFLPTQVYSSLLLLTIYVVLRFLQEKPHKKGEVFIIYLFLYSIKRFFIEFWRTDNPVIFHNLTLFHIMSILLFVFAALALVIIKTRE